MENKKCNINGFIFFISYLSYNFIKEACPCRFGWNFYFFQTGGIIFDPRKKYLAFLVHFWGLFKKLTNNFQNKLGGGGSTPVRKNKKNI